MGQCLLHPHYLAASMFVAAASLAATSSATVTNATAATATYRAMIEGQDSVRTCPVHVAESRVCR